MKPHFRSLTSWSLALCCVFLFALAADAQTSRPKGDPKPGQEKGDAEKKEQEKKEEKKEEKKQASKSSDSAITAVREHIAKQKAGDKPKIDTSKAGWKQRLPMFPSMNFTPGKTYVWNLETSEGTVKIKFLPDVAPNHVANFIYLTELGFFDDLKFHRVINQFMAQGGCPRGDGRGNPGYKFPGEFPRENGQLKVKHDRPGLLSMANAGPGTDGSQFFITFVETPHLDGRHTIFGEVISGMDVVKTLEKFGQRSGRPTKELKIVKATITVE